MTTEQRTFTMEKPVILHHEAAIAHERVDGPVEPQHEPIWQKRSSEVADLDSSYNYKLAIGSWDQIGSLASEVATSVLAQLAEGMSEQLREENRSAKRQKFQKQSSPGQFPAEPSLVSSDDESNGADEPLSRSMSQQIDRMARMSKYMMQIEHYHRLLRAEMMAAAEDEQDL